jgi:phosphohistidine phosphatase
LRHAKSSWDDRELDDFNRPLNDRGWKAARTIGRELKQRGIRFDLGLASPAARVRETLDGIAETYGDFSFAVRFESPIYMASVETLFELVRAIPEESAAPIIIGHNPGLEHLLVELARDDGARLRNRVAAKYPTAGFAIVEFPAERWANVAPGSGTIVELILPREL